MYYQQYNGPLNYQLDSSNGGLIPLEHNDYPLISVIVEPLTAFVTSTLFSTAITNTIISFASSSIYAIYSTPAVTMESTEVTFSASTSSMMSTPVSTLQSTGNNTLIIAGSISTAVFILLVVTILVILIVSVLVCRRRWNKTSNGNNSFRSVKRKADKDQQLDGLNQEKQNTLTTSTNPAYGVSGKTSGVSPNPAYGINTRRIESIDEESLVYDEPRTMMYNKQEVYVNTLL
ncbi:PREDICTED: uncharacterized protein LOC109583964 [Amphimedon queenslandica]|uniref:Uncharacterized protein n=1 Tax=Amphimedon queenslandica TaxID=400682 RepID=A0AAN0JE85_AMPQE|nr:PREDICTED: uncharacterized protein LOC109583964 [Amphimedon queenslandica]|eukprot:XP_019855067.1 PREDICTED: uncharacterized protein LOC109583964 [Amphimedon queenslandica]